MLNLQIKIFGLSGVFLILGIAGVHAQTTLSDITFPIQELQGCASLDACRVFCDDFKNTSACLGFAEKNGLIKKKDVQRALKFIQLLATGDTPVSGCSDQYECANQCALPENQSQCFRWAKDNGLVTNISNGDEPSAPQTDNTGQVETSPTENTDQTISDESNTPEPEVSVAATAIPKTTPTPKKNNSIDTKTTETPEPSDIENQDQSPDQNLQDQTNTQDTTSDQIPPKADRENNHSKQRIEKILALENGPGGCKAFDECAAFCSQSQHTTTCLDFARKHGLMSDQDIQKAEQLISKPGPGGCIGQQCQTYCSDTNHQEACLKFALDNHFISQTEADNIRNSQKLQRGLRTFGGPGGCANEEQCRTYCSQASHVEECLSFGQKTGVFNQQEVQQRKQEFQNQLEQSPPPQGQSDTTPPDIQPTPSQSDQEQSTETPADEHSALPSVVPSTYPQPSSSYTPSPPNSPYPSNTPYPTSTVSPSTACSQYGGTWNGTTCIMPSSTPTLSPTPSPSTSVTSTSPTCPSGQYYDPARQACGTPVDNCTAHGGTWNGTTCIMPSSTPNQTVSPSPSNSPYPSYSPYPTSTVSPSTACSQYGGTWNGTTCIMPSPTPKTSSIISTNSLLSSVLKFLGDLLK